MEGTSRDLVRGALALVACENIRFSSLLAGETDVFAGYGPGHSLVIVRLAQFSLLLFMHSKPNLTSSL